MTELLKGICPKHLRAFLLVLMLTLGMSLVVASTAFADPAPVVVDPNSYAEITKVIERPMGVHLPDTGFNISATPYAVNGRTQTGGTPAISSIAVTTADGIMPDVWVDSTPEVTGIKSIERKLRFDLSDLSFDRPGEYDYLIEVQHNSHYDVTKADNKYMLRLNVDADGTDAHTVSKVAFLDYANGTTGAEVTPRLVSTYTPASSLQIMKEVTGEYADHSAKFNFRVRLTNTEFIAADATVDAVMTDADGANPETHTITYNKWYNFSLQHGWTMDIADLPLGTAFIVTEKAATSYIPSVAVVIGGGTPFVHSTNSKDRSLSSEAALADALQLEDRVISAGENSVTFTNHHPAQSPPHLIMDNLGLIIAAAVGFVAVVLLIAIIRKRRAKK